MASIVVEEIRVVLLLRSGLFLPKQTPLNEALLELDGAIFLVETRIFLNEVPGDSLGLALLAP